MAAPPPTGYGYYAATWTITGSLRNVVVTWGFKNNAGATATSVNALMSTTILFQANGLLDMTSCSSQYTRVQGYTLVNVGGVLQSASTNYSVAGSLGNPAPSPNVSAIMNKRTAVAGRTGRGHMAVPAGYIKEADIGENAVLAGAAVTALDTRAQTSYTASNAQGLPLYLLHASGSTPTAVTSVVISNMVGTQRHRIKR